MLYIASTSDTQTVNCPYSNSGSRWNNFRRNIFKVNVLRHKFIKFISFRNFFQCFLLWRNFPDRFIPLIFLQNQCQSYSLQNTSILEINFYIKCYNIYNWYFCNKYEFWMWNLRENSHQRCKLKMLSKSWIFTSRIKNTHYFLFRR